MVTLEIQSAPGINEPSQITIHFNKIIISNSSTATISFGDDEMDDEAWELNINENHLFLASLTESSFFHCNGKKFSGKKSIKINDQIKIRNVDFRVLMFIPTTEKSNLSNSELLKNACEKNPQVKGIVKNIESELLHYESKANGDPFL